MYLSGKLEIDPSQTTLIKRVKEQGVFKKFLDAMTFGQAAKKQEHETFTAVSILQQIYMGLHSISVDNIIRLSVDDYDFYLDDSGEENDFERAMFEFSARVDPIESELFNNIFLVLEHIKDSIKYLIEIKISRKHQVGEYPIVINVNGVFPEYKLGENETPDDLKKRIKSVFTTQSDYEYFIRNKKLAFNDFLDELEMASKKFIKVDNVKKTSSMQIIRPRTAIKSPEEIRHDRFANPVYYGYYGFDDYFFYSWLWAGLMYDTNIYANDFYLVDDHGRDIINVGDDGFNAGEYNTLNPDEPFEAPVEGNLEFYPDNEFEGELNDANLLNDVESDINDVDEFDEDGDWTDIGGGDD